MGKRKTNKQKRGPLLGAGLLSFCLAGISLVVGFFLGLTMINYNYMNFDAMGDYGIANNVGYLNNVGYMGNPYDAVSTGTLSASGNGILYLFICAGLMIALGTIGISVGLKLLGLAKSSNFTFYTKKGIAISSLVFFGVISAIGIASIVLGFVALSGSGYAGTTFFLSGITIGLSVLCFILVLKEYKTFMKSIKNGEIVIEIEYPRRYVPANQAGNLAYASKQYTGTGVDIDGFQRELVRLDEMRGKGLINDQEYQQLKSHWINKMNNKIF